MHALKNYIYENCKLLAQHKIDERDLENIKERVREQQ